MQTSYAEAIFSLIQKSVQNEPNILLDKILEHKLVHAAFHGNYFNDVFQDDSLLLKRYNAQQKKRRQVEQVLLNLFERSKALGIEYTVIKGFSFEKCIYGNREFRDIGDIDLLVLPQNLQAMHDLLLEMGYCQHLGPSSVSHAKEGRAYALLCALNLKQQNFDSTIPLRRHPTKQQLAPYFKRGYPTIEVHDGFHNLNMGYVTRVIERAGKEKYNLSIDPVDCLIFLLVNTYSNSESFFSNLYGQDIVLRDYLDLQYFFQKFKDELDWDKIYRQIKELGLEFVAGVILNNLNSIFGNFADDGCLSRFLCAESRWQADIVERAFNAGISSKVVHKIFKKEARKRSLKSSITIFNDLNLCLDLNKQALASFALSYDLSLGNVFVNLLPVQSLLDDNYLFQIVFYPLHKNNETFSYRLTIGMFNGELCAFLREATHFIVDMLVKRSAGEPLFIERSSQNEQVLKITLSVHLADILLSEEMAVSFSVFKREHADLFWRIDAGDKPLFDDVSVGKLFNIKRDVSSVNLQFSKMACTFLCNDISFLNEFVQVFGHYSQGISLYEEIKTYKEYQIIKDANFYNLYIDGNLIKDGLDRNDVFGILMQDISDEFCSWVSEAVVVTHAVCVKSHEKVALLMGLSGSGKTSLGVAFSKYDLLVGDECTFVNIEDGSAWCEDFPVQIKKRNEDILKNFDLEDALLVKTRTNGEAYYLSKDTLLHEQNPMTPTPIAVIVFPKYFAESSPACTKTPPIEFLIKELLSSIIGIKTPSSILKDFVHMISERKIKLVSLEYHDVDEAARVLLKILNKQD